MPDDKIRRVVLCTGKVYYDLYEAREAAGIDDVYLLRVEQLYPFPARALMHELSPLQAGGHRVVPGGAQEHGRLEFIEPNIEWVLERIEARVRRPALRRARRRRRRRRRGNCRSTCTSRRRWSTRRSTVRTAFEEEARPGAGQRFGTVWVTLAAR